MPRFFSYKQNWINIFIRQIFGFFVNFRKNSNFSLFINIKWLQLIIRNKKWSMLMILTTKKAAYFAKFAEFVCFVWLCSKVQTVAWLINGHTHLLFEEKILHTCLFSCNKWIMTTLIAHWFKPTRTL